MRTRSLVAAAATAMALALTVIPGSRLIADTARPPAEIPDVLHLALDRSVPEADATVASVDKISLWFTQSPQMGGTTVRVVPQGGEPLDLGKARMSEADDTLIELGVSGGLAPGSYTVHWRAMAQDGHTVRGDFSFRVQAQR